MGLRWVASLALVLVLVSLACAPGTSGTQAGGGSPSVIEEIQRRGTMRIGMSIFVPWTMRGVDGNLVGFEVDVARRLAADLGVEVELVPTAWDGIVPALLSGRFDLIVSGMTITTQRNVTLNFTEPYSYSGMGMVSHRELAAGLESVDDFNRPEITFAARRGATPAMIIARIFPQARLLLFDDDGAGFQEVLNGNAHATVSSEPSPTFWLLDHPEVLTRAAGIEFPRGAKGFALRKGDVDALNVFNNWIRLRWEDGFLEERRRHWFETRDWAPLVAAESDSGASTESDPYLEGSS